MDTFTPIAKTTLDTQVLVFEDESDFRVHGSVYTDEQIFNAEMRDIFGKCWIFVGHESEVRNSGDFKTSFIGRRPVVMSRDEHGEIHVFFNRCRHRGSVVCREERGSVKRFQCQYHGWVYGLDGTLQGVAKHKGGYPDDLDKSRLGLMAVPRVEIYRGLVFANMDANAITFTAYLGAAKPFLDIHFDLAPEGELEVVHGAHLTE